MVGVRSHHSAARDWGIELLDDDGQEHRTVRRSDWRIGVGVRLHRVDLPRGDVRCGSTTPLRTVLDLGRLLPREAAVVSLDSALHNKLVRRHELERRAQQARGPGSAALRRAVADADGRAASPPETLLRLLYRDAYEPLGLTVRPQLQIHGVGHAYDVGLEEVQVVVEVQSLLHHRGRPELERDADVGNQAQAQGWHHLQITVPPLRVHPDRVLLATDRAIEQQRRILRALAA